MGFKIGQNRALWILGTLLGASVVFNVFAVHEVFSLTTRVRVFDANHAGFNPTVRLTGFSATNLSGHRVQVTFGRGDLPVILYSFSPACGWCRRNLNNLAALANVVQGKYRLIGVSLSTEGLADYVSHNHFSFPVYTKLSSDVQQQYKLGGTPQTIVIAQDGRVLKNWRGAYRGSLQKEVEGFFHISLPGLTTMSASRSH